MAAFNYDCAAGLTAARQRDINPDRRGDAGHGSRSAGRSAGNGLNAVREMPCLRPREFYCGFGIEMLPPA